MPEEKRNPRENERKKQRNKNKTINQRRFDSKKNKYTIAGQKRESVIKCGRVRTNFKKTKKRGK